LLQTAREWGRKWPSRRFTAKTDYRTRTEGKKIRDIQPRTGNSRQQGGLTKFVEKSPPIGETMDKKIWVGYGRHLLNKIYRLVWTRKHEIDESTTTQGEKMRAYAPISKGGGRGNGPNNKENRRARRTPIGR